MEIKSAEEFYKDGYDLEECLTSEKNLAVVLEVEQLYNLMNGFAEQFIDLCAEKANVKVTFDTIEGGIVDAEVDKKSILKIKELIK